MFSYCIGTPIFFDEGKLTMLPRNSGLWIEMFLSPIAMTQVIIWVEQELYLYHHQTENSEVLFGFFSKDERGLFRQVLKVNGIGWKTALSLLWLGKEAFIRAIETQDDILLSTVPGIGKKTAQKIIIELKDKASLSSFTVQKPTTEKNISAQSNTSLISALVQMWYDKKRVEYTLEQIPHTITDLQEKTIWAIRELSK